MGWLGRSVVTPGVETSTSHIVSPAAVPPPRTAALLPSASSPARLLYAEELPPRMDACTFEPVVSREHDVQHCPQCASMMCTEQCRYDASWCGAARAFACTADRLPADSVAFFPSIGLDPFPVPRCAPARSLYQHTPDVRENPEPEDPCTTSVRRAEAEEDTRAMKPHHVRSLPYGLASC